MKTDLGNKMPRSVKYNHPMNKTHINFLLVNDEILPSLPALIIL